VLIDFDGAVQAVAPGQSAVLYRGTRVLGSTTIARTLRAVTA